MNKWIYNRYTITFGIILLLIVLLLAVGPLIMEGENLLKLGVTMWYLNESDRDALYIATEKHRYLTYAYDKEVRILNYLPRLPGVDRGNWELEYTDDKEMVFSESDGREVRLPYKLFKGKYIIFTHVDEREM
jgi:hypothetical protein